MCCTCCNRNCLQKIQISAKNLPRLRASRQIVGVCRVFCNNRKERIPINLMSVVWDEQHRNPLYVPYHHPPRSQSPD